MSILNYLPAILAAATLPPDPPPSTPCEGDLLKTEGVVQELCVTRWINSDASKYMVDESVAKTVEYPNNTHIKWTADIPWTPYPNNVASRVWAIWSKDGDKTFEAEAWDWFGNAYVGQKRFSNLPGQDGEIVGFMLSTAYGANGVLCTAQCDTIRSNIITSKRKVD